MVREEVSGKVAPAALSRRDDLLARRIGKRLKAFPLLHRICKAVYVTADRLRHRLSGVPLELDRRARLHSIDEPAEHFFGYYDKCPWDPAGGRVLYHRRAGDDVELVVSGLATGEKTVLGRSETWNWQQGAMLQWWPGSPERVVHNALREGKLAAVIRDSRSGEVLDTLPMPVQTIRRDGRAIISLNYRRLTVCRPDYGYAVEAGNFAANQPDDADGLWRVDVPGGAPELILRIEDLKRHEPLRSMDGAPHRVNHVMYAPSGNRLVFIHRWFTRKGRQDRLYTVNDDGSNLYLLADDGMASHQSWLDADRLLCYCSVAPRGAGYYVLRDRSGTADAFAGGALDAHGDGHPSASPQGRWVVTDTYPAERRMSRLLLFDTDRAESVTVGRFFAPWAFDGPVRCDLHPRWSPDGKWVSVDSVHPRRRGMFLIDVSAIVAEPGSESAPQAAAGPGPGADGG